MENQKILNLLNDANDSKFVTKKGTFSMIIQIQIMWQQKKLPIIQEF